MCERDRERESVCVCVCVCVCVGLIIQNAKRMRPIVICHLPGSKKFSTLCRKRHDFRKNVIEHTRKMPFYFPYKLCLKYFPFKEKSSEILS